MLNLYTYTRAGINICTVIPYGTSMHKISLRKFKPINKVNKHIFDEYQTLNLS